MLHRVSTLLLSVLLVFVGLALAPEAAAQGDDVNARREQARPIALEGFELLQAGKYNEAIAKLEEAERIFHAPTHLLYIGRARKELGDKLSAYNTFIDILVEEIPNYAPKQFLEAKAEAKQEADALVSSIAAVNITVSGVALADATVTIDGSTVDSKRLAYPVGVTAGSHTVEATATGAEPASQTVEGIVGQTQEVSLTLIVADATTGPGPGGDTGTQESSFPVLATITLALGGGALVAGVITGVMTLGKASDIKDQCQGTVCPIEQESEADDAKVLGNVSTAMFVVGGVLATTGIVLLIVDPFNDPAPSGEEAAASLGLRVGPTGAALVGTF